MEDLSEDEVSGGKTPKDGVDNSHQDRNKKKVRRCVRVAPVVDAVVLVVVMWARCTHSMINLEQKIKLREQNHGTIDCSLGGVHIHTVGMSSEHSGAVSCRLVANNNTMDTPTQ